MSTGNGPARRLRQKTCVPAGATVLAQQLPRADRAVSGLSVRVDRQGLRLPLTRLWRSFTGADVLAIVASFLGVRDCARFLGSEKHLCDSEGLWAMLLGRLSHSICAARAGSARASISTMMRGPECAWPADEPAHAYGPSEGLSNLRWCLDFFYCGWQLFSAVIPVTGLSARDLRAERSLYSQDSGRRRRVANLLPLHRVPVPVLELLHDAWSRKTDPVLPSRGWTHDLHHRDEFHRHTMTCSCWLFDTHSRELVAKVCRDAHWGACSGNFRFYISEEFDWTGHVSDFDGGSDEASDVEGRALEVWVLFRCTSNAEGAYDLSCSTRALIADGTLNPADSYMSEDLRWRDPAEDPSLVWERRRATPWDLKCALGV